MDGAKPQWINSSYLEDTLALDEWEEAEEEEEETHDPPDFFPLSALLSANGSKEQSGCVFSL
eukprot:12428961-Ditylum_brightwellii.AAC.1